MRRIDVSTARGHLIAQPNWGYNHRVVPIQRKIKSARWRERYHIVLVAHSRLSPPLAPALT